MPAPCGWGVHVEDRGSAIAPGLATEALLMRSARDVGVPEPEVHYVLRARMTDWVTASSCSGWKVKRSARGSRAHRILLTAWQAGVSVWRVHGAGFTAVDLDATGLRDRLETSTPEQFVEQTWERYRLLDTPQPMIDYTGRWLMEHLPEDYDLALVHNDFRNGNFMVDGERINAVLDWEIAHIGDPDAGSGLDLHELLALWGDRAAGGRIRQA